jgi:hypothetical protein
MMSAPAFQYVYRTVLQLLIVLAVFSFGPATTVVAREEIQADIRFLYVQPGQTLHNIVRRLYPERPKDWERLEQQIVRENPHAFINGDKTKLKADVRIDLPRRMVVKPRPIANKPVRAGEVISSRGQASAVGQDRKSRALGVGHGVFVGDKIVTGEDGFVQLLMVDGARVDLRCYSIMVIEKYDLQSTRRSSILKLLQGSVHKVSGEIGKAKGDVYEMKTPVASVGVRGTEYALRVFQSKGCDGSIDTGDEGLYVKVLEGAVDVQNKAAETAVAKNDTLYIPQLDKRPVEKDIKPGVIEPLKEEVEAEDESTSAWWWAVLGVIALALAI